MKKCPYCAEEIQDGAVVCKHCGRDLVAPKTEKKPHRIDGYVFLGAFVLLILGCGMFRAESEGRTPSPTENPTEAETGADSVVIASFTPVAIDTPVPTRTPASTSAPDLPPFRIIARQAINNMVVVEPPYSTDSQALLVISKQICSGEDIGVVLIWDDESKAAQSLPMTDQQVNDQVAQYNINKNSGLDRLLLCNQGHCNEP